MRTEEPVGNLDGLSEEPVGNLDTQEWRHRTLRFALSDESGFPVCVSLRQLLTRVACVTGNEENPEFNRPWLEEVLGCEIPTDESNTVTLEGDYVRVKRHGIEATLDILLKDHPYE